MHNTMIRMIIHAAALCALAACSTPSDPESTMLGLGGGRVTLAGANQMFPADTFEKIDLLMELDPENRRSFIISKNSPCNLLNISQGSVIPDACKIEQQKEVTAAFYAFYSYPAVPMTLEARRNRLQDRILAASEQRCNIYKTYMKRQQTETDFWFGFATTVLGGAGALFTNTTAPRLLSGLAGISSGINAEFNQSYFANLAAHVIIEGIERRRDRYWKSIQETREKNKSVDQYTIEAAVQDAVTFHGACHVVPGLQEASDSIQEVANPGLRSFTQTAAMFGQAQRAMRGELSETEMTKALSSGRPDRYSGRSGRPRSVAFTAGGAGVVLPANHLLSVIVGLRDDMNSFEAWTRENVKPAASATGTPKDFPTTVIAAARALHDSAVAHAEELRSCDTGTDLSETVFATQGNLQLKPDDLDRRLAADRALQIAQETLILPAGWLLDRQRGAFEAARKELATPSGSVPSSLDKTLFDKIKKDPKTSCWVLAS